MNQPVYSERILAYYRSSAYRGVLSIPDISAQARQPSCGDVLQVQGHVRDGVITELRFQGDGCIISQAAAAAVCEYIEGKTISEVSSVGEAEIKKLLEIDLGPVRMRCALLVVQALHSALAKYQKTHD